jgi:hypothetical protein
VGAGLSYVTDRWLVLAACVWLAALVVAGPLVKWQLHLLPVALRPALPVLVGVWRTFARRPAAE